MLQNHVHAPVPCFRVIQIIDIVTIGEDQPLSKMVCFNLLKVTKATSTKKQFQKFSDWMPVHFLK